MPVSERKEGNRTMCYRSRREPQAASLDAHQVLMTVEGGLGLMR
jgi:hypothetical protein